MKNLICLFFTFICFNKCNAQEIIAMYDNLTFYTDNLCSITKTSKTGSWIQDGYNFMMIFETDEGSLIIDGEGRVGVDKKLSLHNRFGGSWDTYLIKSAVKIKEKSNSEIASELNKKGAKEWNNNNVDLALDYFTQAIELNPDVASYYNNRGLCYKDKDMLIEAEADFLKVIEINSGEENKLVKGYLAEIYNKYAQKKAGEGDYSSAIEFLNKVIEYKGNDFNTLLIIGNWCFEISDYQNAIANYTKLGGWGNYNWKIGTALSYFELGDNEKAKYYFEMFPKVVNDPYLSVISDKQKAILKVMVRELYSQSELQKLISEYDLKN